MVYSIVRHLWKKWKMKKFLPLPPLHKSLQAPFDIQGPLLDSASEEEGESSPRVSSVPESVSTNHHCNFSFGNFHFVVVPIKLIDAVQPQIEGNIKIGEINCFTVSENSESITSKNEVQLDPESKVKEFVKMSINKSWSSSSIGDISFATIAILNKDFSEPMDRVQDSRRDYFSITMKNHSTSSFANHNLKGIVLLDMDLISLHMCSLLHNSNNTVLAVIETVFDTGGIVKPLSGTITLISTSPSTFRLIIMFTIEISVEFVVTVFDPGGVTEFIFVAWFSVCYYLNLSRNNGMPQEMEAFDSFFVWALDRCCEGDCGSEECVAVLIPVEIAADFAVIIFLALSSLFAFIYEICIAFGVLEQLVLQKRV
jgi:hypothetical protein